jgi:hypothetical protein
MPSLILEGCESQKKDRISFEFNRFLTFEISGGKLASSLKIFGRLPN